MVRLAESAAEIRMFDLCFVLIGFLIGLIVAWTILREPCDCEEDWRIEELLPDVPPRSDVRGQS